MLVAGWQSSASSPEVVTINPADGSHTPISSFNAERAAALLDGTPPDHAASAEDVRTLIEEIFHMAPGTAGDSATSGAFTRSAATGVSPECSNSLSPYGSGAAQLLTRSAIPSVTTDTVNSPTCSTFLNVSFLEPLRPMR